MRFNFKTFETVALAAVLLATVALAPALAQAEPCETLFNVRPFPKGVDHFVSAKDFYASPVDPDTQMLGGEIVITKSLADLMFAKKATKISAYTVVDLKGMTEKQFSGLMRRAYNLKVVTNGDFSVGFLDVRLVGSSANVLRFLKNDFAKHNVLWAGTKPGEKYIDHVTPFFTEPVEVANTFERNSRNPEANRWNRGGSFADRGYDNRDAQYEFDRGNDSDSLGARY